MDVIIIDVIIIDIIIIVIILRSFLSFIILYRFLTAQEKKILRNAYR